MNWYLETKSLLTEDLAGFREKISTACQTSRFKETFNQRESVIAALVDFKGLYDTVWTNKIFQKNTHTKVKEYMLRWFLRFLLQRD